MKELAFSFYDCTPVPQEPHFTVLPDPTSPEGCAVASYIVVAEAARDFRGWLTVTAAWFSRTVVRKVRAFVRSAVYTSGMQILATVLRLPAVKPTRRSSAS